MKYPQEFVEEVKQVYPDWETLHQELTENGDVYVVSRCLEENCGNGISYDEILAADGIEGLEMLKAKARLGKRRNKLYNEFTKLELE